MFVMAIMLPEGRGTAPYGDESVIPPHVDYDTEVGPNSFSISEQSPWPCSRTLRGRSCIMHIVTKLRKYCDRKAHARGRDLLPRHSHSGSREMGQGTAAAWRGRILERAGLCPVAVYTDDICVLREGQVFSDGVCKAYG